VGRKGTVGLISPTILVVEDNPITRKMLRAALEHAGFSVAEAGDRREALAATAARRPDLLVLDYLVVPFGAQGHDVGAVVLASDVQDLSESTWIGFAQSVAAQFGQTVALGQSLTRLRQMAESNREVFWLADPDFTEVLYVSPAYEPIFGRSRQSLYQDPESWWEAIQAEDRERVRSLICGGAAADTDETYRIARPDGSTRWIRGRAFPIRDASGGIVRCAGVAEDVTDRKRAEEERDELSRRLVNLQEEERRTVARELHDEVGQLLTGLKLMIARADDPGTPSSREEMTQLVNELIRRVRDLSMDLRPPTLDELGLLPTLLWHIERYTRQTGIQVDLRHKNLRRRFPPEIEMTAVRIVQEALTNVARHSGVARAKVTVRAEPARLRLRIEDEGRGFRLETPQAGHSSGLEGMRERCRLLGGHLAIETLPGSGTRLSVNLPLTGHSDREA
jgi:PAS domain S-box-containing protein